MRKSFKISALLGGLAAAGAVAFVGVTGASARSITADAQHPVIWTCQNNASRALAGGLRTFTGNNTYPGCAHGYTVFSWNQKGADGAAGQDLTKVSASGVTQVSNREDGGHGTPSVWADDSMTRTVNVTLDHEVPAAQCGAGAASCFAYFGTVTDDGTFRSVAGGKSPHAGVDIAGIVQGQIQGVSSVEFVASSGQPDGTLVPAVASGNAISTGVWARQLFPSGTTFGAETQPAYAYTYSAPGTCEIWTDSSNNSDGTSASAGDIQGVNHCG